MSRSQYFTVERSLCTGLELGLELLFVTIPICHSREFFMHRVRVRATAGSLCVTMPISHSRELLKHRVRVRIALCHNSDMSQQSSLCTGLGFGLQRDPLCDM